MNNVTHIGVHTHEYGMTLYPIHFTGEGHPCARTFVKQHNINVEPHRGETFQIDSLQGEEALPLFASAPDAMGIYPE